MSNGSQLQESVSRQLESKTDGSSARISHLIEEYHALGARYVTLAHNGHNDISDSANPNARFRG